MKEIKTTIESENFSAGFIAGHSEGMKEAALECVKIIETYQIPVGNSAAGELACDWTYDALKTIRNEIKQHFGIE
jgi:hypothetical protein